VLTVTRWKEGIAFLCLLFGATTPGMAGSGGPIQQFVPRIVATFPHDPGAWTQGLVFHDGGFYESTGLYGRSSVRRVAAASGEVERIQRLAQAFYGEGLARVGDRLIQVTWKSGRGFVYRRSDFRRERTFSYEGQGWGLAWDGKRLILSDGTPVLRFLDPESFAVTERRTVRREGVPVKGLNELEWVRGELYANLWPTDFVAIIDPESGRVTGEIDLSGLREKLPPPAPMTDPPNVANGIAYDPDNDRLFVTGKFWPRVFEVRLEEKVLGQPSDASPPEQDD
jgi:glutaminyl-peptide cyclotransferase